jgi:hypothetical protein
VICLYGGHRSGDVLRVIRQVPRYYNTGTKVIVTDTTLATVTVCDEHGVECKFGFGMVGIHLESTGERCTSKK